MLYVKQGGPGFFKKWCQNSLQAAIFMVKKSNIGGVAYK
jgi:hypothetical protein